MAIGIRDDVIKVPTLTTYLTNIAMLLWHRRSVDVKRKASPTMLWEEFRMDCRH